MSIGPELLQKNWKLFVKFGATKTCTYQSMLESEYVDGNVTKPIDSSHTLEIIFKKINATLVDESTILFIDRIAVFPVLDLPVDPKINDIIVDDSLVEWEVKDVVQDPMDMHFELRVRPIT